MLTLKVKIGSEYNDIGRTCVETFLTLSSLVSSALLGLSASGQTPKPEWNKALQTSSFANCPLTKFQVRDIKKCFDFTFLVFIWLQQMSKSFDTEFYTLGLHRTMELFLWRRGCFRLSIFPQTPSFFPSLSTSTHIQTHTQKHTSWVLTSFLFSLLVYKPCIKKLSFLWFKD